MHRRTFLRNLSLSTGLAALSPRALFAKAEPPTSPPPAWTALLEYARWAPSPHNLQPWKLHLVSATEAHLCYDPARLLPYTDPTSAFLTVALGMFVECLRIAAAPHGWQLQATYETEQQLAFTPATPPRLAVLRLIPGAAPVTFDPELIRRRRTSRLPYDGRPLAGPVQLLLQAVAATHVHTLRCSSDPDLVDFVLHLNSQTLFTDLDDPQSRQEIGRWIRTSDAEAQARQDGLWSRCMGFPGRLMHNFFFHSERFRSAWKRSVLGNVYRRSMRGTSTVAWLSGPFETRPDWLAAGTALQQLWLTLTQHGAYLHPFGSVVTNAAAHAQFLARIQHPAGSGQLWLLVRFGYSHEPPRSLRLSVSDLLV